MFVRTIPPRSISFLGLDSPGVPGPGLVLTQGPTPPPAAAPERGGTSIGTWLIVAAIAVGGWYAWTKREELFGIKPAPLPRKETPADYGGDEDYEGDEPGWEPGEREARTKQTVDDLVGGFMLDDGDVGMDNPPVLAEVKRGLKARGYRLKPKEWGYVAVPA